VSVDAKCRNLTAPWVIQPCPDPRAHALTISMIGKVREAKGQVCDFFEDLETAGGDAVLPEGVYTLEDVKEFGKEKNWCVVREGMYA
jgi:DNA excision repair protein ERCC-2